MEGVRLPGHVTDHKSSAFPFLEPIPSLSRGTSNSTSSAPSTTVTPAMSDVGNPASAGHTLPPGKNPFTTFADWDEHTLSQLKVVIVEPRETTGEYTRNKDKTGRYWKSIVSFSFGSYTSETIKVSNVQVPYFKKENYATSYVYASINAAVAKVIKKAALEAGINLDCNEERLVSNNEQWWKTVNKIEGNFGTLSSSQQFTPKDMVAILDKTKKGIQTQAELSFFVKFSTNDGSDRSNIGLHRLAVEATRMFIKGLRVEVQPPTVIKKAPVGSATSKVGPSVVSRSDVSPDDVLGELEALGI